ncbi:restriction endonuclease, partial [Klebsiella oxytoca]
FISLLRSLCSRPLMGRTVSREENLTGKARGRIVFSRNIRHNTLRGRDDRLYCRYLQYTEDILENQILKAALKKAEA